MCKMFSVESVGMRTNGKLRLPFGMLTNDTSETISSIRPSLSEMLNQTREKSFCIMEGTWFFELFRKGFHRGFNIWAVGAADSRISSNREMLAPLLC